MNRIDQAEDERPERDAPREPGGARPLGTLVMCVLVALALGRVGLTSRPATPGRDGVRAVVAQRQGAGAFYPGAAAEQEQSRAGARPYSDPTPAWVAGALRGGASDPAILVDEGWTPEQKRKWSAQFNALLADRRCLALEAQEQEQLVRGRAIFVRSKLPLVRDVAEGVVQAMGGLASMALRALESTPLLAPTAGQEKLADTAVRALEERERVYAFASESGAMGWLQWLARSPLFLPGVGLALWLAARVRPAGLRRVAGDVLPLSGRGEQCSLCLRRVRRLDGTCLRCQGALQRLDAQASDRRIVAQVQADTSAQATALPAKPEPGAAPA